MTENKKEYQKKRLQQVKEKKLLVIDKAQRLFLDKGLHNVTMNDIMKETGIGKATMYRYFESIHTIAFEVQYRMMQEVYSDFLVLDFEGLEPKDMLELVLISMIDGFHTHRKAYAYISMFDHLYANAYPDKRLSDEYENTLRKLLNGVVKEEIDKSILAEVLTYIGIVSAYLQKMAVRKEIFDQSDLDVNERLLILKKMFHNMFKL